MPIVGPISASAGSVYIPVTGSLVLIGESTTFITGSTLVTGSMIITGSLITSGSTTITGSTLITGSMIITGSLTVTGSDTFTVHGPSIFNGNIESSGFVTASMGLSGSLTRLVNGTSYLAAGDNITITSASNGQVVVTSVGGSPGGSTTELQYNNGGAFDGVSAFQSDGTNITLLDAGQLRIGTGTDLVISSSNDQVYFGLSTTNKDLIFTSIEEEIMRIDESHNSVAIGVNANTVAKLLVDVEDEEDDHGIKIQQADSTNSKRALWIDSAAAGIYMTAKDGIQVVVNEDNGYGFLTSRNKATVDAPLVKIRDQLGDESALKVIQESADTSAFAIEIANASATKTTLSGSGQVGIGKGTTAYNAMLHVKGISRGDGIVLEDASSADIVVKMYESTDDGVIDVYANNSVTARIHGNGTSYINTGGNFGIGTATPAHVLSVVGAVSASLGLSGSLTRLVDGTSYLAAGTNVTIASASNGQVTISSTGGSGSPAGSDTQIQYNNAGTFGAIAAFTWDDTNLTIDSAARLQFRDSDIYIESPADGKLNISSDSKVLILSGGGAGSFDEAAASDVNFYVSGTVGSAKTATRGTSVFGGDVVISGSLFGGSPLSIGGDLTVSGSVILSGSSPTEITGSLSVTGSMDVSGSLTVSGSDTFTVYGPSVFNEGGASDSDFRVETDGEDEALFIDSANNKLYINKGNTSFITTIGGAGTAEALRVNAGGVVLNMNGHAANDFRVETSGKENAIFVDAGTDQVLILSGGSPTSNNESNYSDTVFFVSGTIGSRGTATKGTSVFGGDTVISGSLYLDELAVTPGVIPDGTVAVYGKDDSGVTKLYFKNESGETEIGSGGGSGISWDGSTANGIATYKDADEATVEANFTFNGTDGLIASAGRMQFRDLGLFIHSPADGQLAIEADTTLSLTGSGAAINAVAIMTNNVGGGIDVDSGTGGYNNTSTGVLALSSSFNDPSAIQITATAGGMDITCEGAAGEDIDIANANGSIRIVAEENVPDAIEIVAAPGGIILSANDTTSGIQIAAGNSGVPVLIGHTTSETTVQDNLSVTGNLTVNGALAEISGTLSIEATGTEAIRINKEDADTREIVFEQNGSDIASIFCNAAESLRIKNETTNGTITLQAKDASTVFNILTIAGENQSVGIGTTSPAGVLDVQGIPPAPGANASSQVFILSGSGSPMSTDESLYSDTALFVSGGIGTKDTAIKGTSVFGGDLVSSGSIFGTMKHFYHFSANVTNINENWLKSGGNDAGSPFDRGNHQWIAPYGGKLQAATVRSDATDGVNSLDVKFYSSPGGDATSGGTTKTSNFIISSTDIAFSDILLDHSIAPGDSLGVSVQRAGTNPGKVNVTLIVEYDIMSNII